MSSATRLTAPPPRVGFRGAPPARTLKEDPVPHGSSDEGRAPKQPVIIPRVLPGPGPRHYRRRLLVLFMADVLALSLCMVMAAGGHTLVFGIGQVLPRALAAGVALATGLFAASGLYSVFPRQPVIEVRTIAYGLGAACGLLAVTSLAIAPILSSGLRISGVLGFAFGLAVFAVPTARLTARALFAGRPWWGCQTVVLSDGQEGHDLVEMLRRRPELGLTPTVVLDDRAEAGNKIADVLVAGPLSLAPRYALEHRVPYAVVAMPSAGRERIVEVVDQYARHFDRVLVVPDLAGLTSLWVSARDLDGTLGLEIRHRLLARWRQRLKRAVDLVTVVALAPFLLPIGLLLAAIIKLDDREGAVLYRQDRLGRGGRCFTLYKFRSMRTGAEGLLRELLARDPAAREEYAHYAKLKNDPRVTRVGRWLRKTSLDELPQLLNVFRGEMSLVGPRAYLPGELERMGGKEQTILRVRPGITGLWQVSGRNRLPFDNRLDLDVRYIRNWSVSLDLYLLARTVPVVLTGHGAA